MNVGWWAAVSGLVLLGVVLVVVSRGSRPEPDTSAGTPIGGHWHVAFGGYVCGDWVLPNPPELRPLPDPHTHGDGIIHSEPQSHASAYLNATLGRYADNFDWSVSATEFKTWTGRTYENGDRCPGSDKPGIVRWTVNGEERRGDPSEYVIQDGDVVVIAFMPRDEDFPTAPPWTADMARNGSPINHPDFAPQGATTTTGAAGAGATTTTGAAGAGATTTTGAAGPGGTTTTGAAGE